MEYQIIVSIVCVHVVRFRQSVLRTGTDRHAAGYHGNQDANIWIQHISRISERQISHWLRQPDVWGNGKKHQLYQRITRCKKRLRLAEEPCDALSVEILSTGALLYKQKAQLSPRDRAMRRVSRNLANCHATVQKLLVRQVLNQVSVVANWPVRQNRAVDSAWRSVR